MPFHDPSEIHPGPDVQLVEGVAHVRAARGGQARDLKLGVGERVPLVPYPDACLYLLYKPHSLVMVMAKRPPGLHISLAGKVYCSSRKMTVA